MSNDDVYIFHEMIPREYSARLTKKSDNEFEISLITSAFRIFRPKRLYLLTYSILILLMVIDYAIVLMSSNYIYFIWILLLVIIAFLIRKPLAVYIQGENKKIYTKPDVIWSQQFRIIKKNDENTIGDDKQKEENNSDEKSANNKECINISVIGTTHLLGKIPINLMYGEFRRKLADGLQLDSLTSDKTEHLQINRQFYPVCMTETNTIIPLLPLKYHNAAYNHLFYLLSNTTKFYQILLDSFPELNIESTDYLNDFILFRSGFNAEYYSEYDITSADGVTYINLDKNYYF
ncbi:MAG: hypothetical protein OEZ01_11610 [Candidatus Heimdallarchaeota archaeon]|nr:hypothetical protein [Candidatus Heimdallarchaeota archaeon]